MLTLGVFFARNGKPHEMAPNIERLDDSKPLLANIDLNKMRKWKGNESTALNIHTVEEAKKEANVKMNKK